MLTRRRLLIAAGAVAALLLVAWFAGRKPAARWAVQRALRAAGLEPATFEVEDVGVSGARLGHLSVGASPWLTAEAVNVTYSAGGLLGGRVRTIIASGATWTVRVRDRGIDWGYAPRTRDGPIVLDMPLHRLDLTAGTLRIITQEGTYDIPLNARLTPGPGAIAARLDAAIDGRAVGLTADATSSPETLTVEVQGQAGMPRAELPEATFRFSFSRAHADGASQIDAQATVHALVERLADSDVTLTDAHLTFNGAFDGDWTPGPLTATLEGDGLQVGALSVRTFALTADKGDGPRVQLHAAAAGEGWQLPSVQGVLTWRTAPDSETSSTIALDARTTDPAMLTGELLGLTGQIGSIAGHATLALDTRAIQSGALSVSGGSLRAGDVMISDARAQAAMHAPDAISFTTLEATIGDGSTIAAAPFTFDPAAPILQTRVTASNLSLADWLPLVSGGHASGQGRVSGHADVALDWTGPRPRLTRLTGALGADPSHGYIQVTDAQTLGDLLERQDPRFAEGEVMAPVRDKIVAALQDFAYTILTVDLARRDDRTIAVTRLSGFGRHGQDPQGINLTLDLQAQDAAIGLASRILGQARMREAAGDALDKFFQGGP